MAYAGKGISVLNPNRNDDIVRNDKRIGQERTLNGGRAIQQNVIVGVQSCLIERLPETEKALDGIGKRAYRSVYVQIGRDQIQLRIWKARPLPKTRAR